MAITLSNLGLALKPTPNQRILLDYQRINFNDIASVGMPLDLLVYRNDSIDGIVEQRINENDDYFAMMRDKWSEGLTEAHTRIPPPDWLSP